MMCKNVSMFIVSNVIFLLFSDPNKTVESDDTTLCDNISDTLIASDNENDTCTSVSEEDDITDNEHGNICAHHVPCNDDIHY
jgi:hypothetical protein